jgi:hypothetical protein
MKKVKIFGNWNYWFRKVSIFFKAILGQATINNPEDWEIVAKKLF